MEIYFNDLSIHGQFQDIETFLKALETALAVRKVARQYGREVYCHRNMGNSRVTHSKSLSQALGAMDIEKRRALTAWFTQNGPFWEERRLHGENDYLDCCGELVTNSGLGEAAVNRICEVDARTISLEPSNWNVTPLEVVLHENSVGAALRISVENYWESHTLAAALESVPVLLKCWQDLVDCAGTRYPKIHFVPKCFEQLASHPFVPGAAKRIQVLLSILDTLKEKLDTGKNGEAASMISKYFSGVEAWFTDSSDTEKSEFDSALSFPHPEKSGAKLKCTWHGKVNHPKFRIHFSWPITRNSPLYVVYVGPKLTKR